MLTQILELTARLIATWLVVDLISGVVHWCEDSYGRPSATFVGRRISKPNLLHHYRPRAFAMNSWLTSSSLLLSACATALVVAWAVGRLTPMVVVAAILGTNANQVHKWSHRSESENGPLITALQRLRLLQTPAHHLQHHLGHRNSNYCVLTNLLNPLLDRSGFWRGLEWAIERATGLATRDDDTALAALLSEEPGFLNDAD